MEDMIFKIGEFGALGIITLYLLTKGTDALNKLAESNKLLADSVTKLAEKVNSQDNRFNAIEQQLRSNENQLNELHRFIKDSRRDGDGS